MSAYFLRIKEKKKPYTLDSHRNIFDVQYAATAMQVFPVYIFVHFYQMHATVQPCVPEFGEFVFQETHNGYVVALQEFYI